MSSSLFNVICYEFWKHCNFSSWKKNIFLNFVPREINLYTFRQENLKIIWRSPLRKKKKVWTLKMQTYLQCIHHSLRGVGGHIAILNTRAIVSCRGRVPMCVHENQNMHTCRVHFKQTLLFYKISSPTGVHQTIHHVHAHL